MHIALICDTLCVFGGIMLKIISSGGCLNFPTMSADREIYLDLYDRHEMAYFESLSGGIKVLDHLVAEKFIRKGDIVGDIGANIGVCSMFYFLNGASKVFAFEPHPGNYLKLLMLANGYDDLVVSNYALTDSIGEMDLIISASHNQGHSLNEQWVEACSNVFGPKPIKYPVKTSTLDTVLGNQHIDFLKIDIEGVEPEFLRGAENLLSNDPPRVIHIEIYPAILDTTMNLLNTYYDHIYRCYVHFNSDGKQEIVLRQLNDSRIPTSLDYNHPPTYICLLSD